MLIEKYKKAGKGCRETLQKYWYGFDKNSILA
jgi:hypothetical protein